MSNKIKTIIPFSCPHCGEGSLAEFSVDAPSLVDVYTNEDVTTAKNSLIGKILGLPLDDAIKDGVIQWIEKEDTVFGPSEVEEIIENLKEQHGINIKDI